MLSRGKNFHELRQSAKRIFMAGTGVLLALSLSGCYLFPEETVVLKPPLKTPPQVTYDSMEVKRTNLESKVTGSGTFESINRKEYSFKIGGKKLKAIYVKYSM
jgi:multidrug efflux pump subunit AcrA (membrane-fusion protein)